MFPLYFASIVFFQITEAFMFERILIHDLFFTKHSCSISRFLIPCLPHCKIGSELSLTPCIHRKSVRLVWFFCLKLMLSAQFRDSGTRLMLDLAPIVLGMLRYARKDEIREKDMLILSSSRILICLKEARPFPRYKALVPEFRLGG